MSSRSHCIHKGVIFHIFKFKYQHLSKIKINRNLEVLKMKTKNKLVKDLEKNGIVLDDSMPYSPKIIMLNGKPSDYVICTDGSLYNISTMKAKKATEMANGYMRYTLYMNGKQYHKYVHRLVAEAFIRNPKNKPEVNHKDRNKKNNDISNLEWTTKKENNDHANNTHVEGKNDVGQPNPKNKIEKCIKMLENGKKSPKKISKKLGLRPDVVYKIKNKQRYAYLTKGKNLSTGEKFKDSKKYSDEKIRTVCELLAQNELTPVEIGKKCGIPQSYILEILHLKKRSDISKEYDFSKYDKKIQREEYDKSVIDKIDELLLKGYRNCEVRDILGFPKTTRYKSLVNNRKNNLRKYEKLK